MYCGGVGHKASDCNKASVTTFSLFTYLIHVSLVYVALLLLTSFTLCAAFPFTPVSYAAFPYSLTLVSYTRCLLSILLLHSSYMQPRFHIYINYHHSRVFFSSLFVQSSLQEILLLYSQCSQSLNLFWNQGCLLSRLIVQSLTKERTHPEPTPALHCCVK